jgi:hypothetical protein
MSLIMTQSPLAANLASLGERNADVAERIRAAKPAPGLRVRESAAGPLSGTLDGAGLASARDPLGEAERLADTIDVVEHAVVVVLGFGLGYHVEVLARRLKKAGLIIVFESDVPLLRAVFERIDHSAWLAQALVLIVTDPDDRGALGAKLSGAESMFAQGTTILEHPPSQRRLGAAASRFTTVFSEYITTAKTTLVTTLVRSIDTVRNLLHNVDRYVGGAGVGPLRDTAAGFPAVVVSAGPTGSRSRACATGASSSPCRPRSSPSSTRASGRTS